MKRRELLMLVASSGTAFSPPLLDGSEKTLDHIVDSGRADSNEADPKMEEDTGTIELTVELY